MDDLQPGGLLWTRHLPDVCVRLDHKRGGVWAGTIVASHDVGAVGLMLDLGPLELAQWERVDLGKWTQADIDAINRKAHETYDRLARAWS